MLSKTFHRLAAATLMLAALAPAHAAASSMSVGYQPMIATGLAAHHPFEAWLWFDKSRDPAVPGYEIPAGATMRITFPRAFVPKPGLPIGVVLLNGWVQGPIQAKTSIAPDPGDPRTLVLRFEEPVAANPPEAPGLKSIHLRTNELNPPRPGAYPISVRFENAGALEGTATAIAHITAAPIPNIAGYNHLSGGKDQEWQHAKVGAEAALPIDFLVTLPSEARSVVSLRPASAGGLDILSDGKPIGTIRTEGVPVTLTPVAFGPGYARLGIVRVRAKAGDTPGEAKIVAALDGGTRFTDHLVVER